MRQTRSSPCIYACISKKRQGWISVAFVYIACTTSYQATMGYISAHSTHVQREGFFDFCDHFRDTSALQRLYFLRTMCDNSIFNTSSCLSRSYRHCILSFKLDKRRILRFVCDIGETTKNFNLLTCDNERKKGNL